MCFIKRVQLLLASMLFLFLFFLYQFHVCYVQLCVLQGKYMDIEFDFKGDPVGGIISNCKQHSYVYDLLQGFFQCQGLALPLDMLLMCKGIPNNPFCSPPPNAKSKRPFLPFYSNAHAIIQCCHDRCLKFLRHFLFQALGIIIIVCMSVCVYVCVCVCMCVCVCVYDTC